MDKLTIEQKLEVAKMATDMTIAIASQKTNTPFIYVEKDKKVSASEPVMLFDTVYQRILSTIVPDETPQ